MGSTLVWLQGQTCGGNTISLMNAHGPDFCSFLEAMTIEVIYHPSLSTVWGAELEQLLADMAAMRQPLDLFLFEGAIPTKGTGWYSTLGGRPIQEVVQELARVARYVVAVGNCAVHGGIPAMAPNPTGARGLQWSLAEPGGVLGADFRSRSGFRVINLTGCPVPPHLLCRTLQLITQDRLSPDDLDQHGRIAAFYSPEGGCVQAEGYVHKHCIHCARMAWQPSGDPLQEELRPACHPVQFD